MQLSVADFLNLYNKLCILRSHTFVMPISWNWMKESTPIIFLMNSMVKYITLEPLGVPDLHPSSQDHPQKSEIVPDGCQIISGLNEGINPIPFPNEN